jgi:serine phosphatase RsbU (regulator of sigma subunit)
VPEPLRSVQRLAALRATGLDATSDAAFETYARLVRRLLGVPVALVSLVDDRRQFFPGASGLGGHWDAERETPLSHSFCQHVVTSGKELVVTDAPSDPALCGNLAIPDLGVVAYAGMPITDVDGLVLGSLCAIDTEPRVWTGAELDLLRDLAEACSAELRLRIGTAAAHAARTRAEQVSAQLTLLARVGKAVGSTLDGDEALRRLAKLLVPVLADRVRADRLDAGSARVVVAGPPPEALAQVLAGRLPHAGTGGELVLALRGRGGVLGALTVRRDRPYDPAERDLLLEVAARASLAVDNAGHYQVQRRAAAALQETLLTRLPERPGLRLAARYVPAVAGADVGGDWYDAFGVSPDGTALVIGDVVGHDLRAAGEMGQLRGMLRTLAYDRDEPPAVLLARLDRALLGLRAGTLATAVLARADHDPATGRVTVHWSNAGHPPPVLLRVDGQSVALDDPAAHGPMLGVVAGARRGDATVGLDPGDTLLLVTDGLVESRRVPLETGLLRLRQVAAGHATDDPEALCDALVAALTGPGTTDDAAVLAVRVG